MSVERFARSSAMLNGPPASAAALSRAHRAQRGIPVLAVEVVVIAGTHGETGDERPHVLPVERRREVVDDAHAAHSTESLGPAQGRLYAEAVRRSSGAPWVRSSYPPAWC